MADLMDVKKILDDLIGNLQNQAQLSEIGIASERIIRKRTRTGRDIEGRPFKPYSDAYAEKRLELGLPVDKVDLVFDDQFGMIRNIDHKVASDLKSVSLDIADARKKKIASYHNELGVGKRGENLRPFWGLGKKGEEDISKLVGEKMVAKLNELLQAQNRE